MSIEAAMGDVVNIRAQRKGTRTLPSDKRKLHRDDFVHGQQVLANAIFHWKNDPAPDAREAVRFLMHHLATAFRSDDGPLQPKPLQSDTLPAEAKSFAPDS